MLSRSTALALTCLASPLFAQEPTLVKDINPTGSSSIDQMTCLDGKVYFRANDGTHGAEPWVSDGTTAGTFLLRDIATGSTASYPGPFIAFHDRIYFGANDGVNGEQLWVTDGTPAGTAIVPDVYTDLTSAVGFTVVGELIYFQGTSDATGAELWATDGTSAGTHLVKDIRTGTEGSYAGHFGAFGDRVFFSADDGTSGSELWASDGTAAGTVLIKDILPFGSSNPDQFAALGSHLLFAAYDEVHGMEPWITDGTEAGTLLLKDINPGGDSAPREFSILNGLAYFGAGNSTTGGEVWVTDGTTDGTTLFMDIFPGSTSSQARRLTVSGGRLYFSAMSNYDDLTQLWRSDGTVAGTQAVFDAAHTPGPLNSNNGIRGCDGRIYFDAGFTVAIGEELYTLDVSTGITGSAQAGGSPLWPNPTSGLVHLPGLPGGRVELLALDGRTIHRGPVTTELDLGGLPSGAYLVRLTDARGAVRVERLMKD